MASNKGGLFVRDKAYNFYNHINRELVREIIDNPINLYKISPYDTSANIYGESDAKRYYPPVTIYGLINNSPEEVTTDDFGPDTTQVLVVAFNREMLRVQHNILPEVGDIMEWNSSYFEITNVDESKMPGGHTEYDFTYVCYAHMTRQNIVLIEDNTRVGQN
jgi:hypothetical protein